MKILDRIKNIFKKKGKEDRAKPLPDLTREEIVDLLFQEVSLLNKERLFYSPNKEKIVYIYERPDGYYSVNEEEIIFYDEAERFYQGRYGDWCPCSRPFASFYGTVEEALKGIELDVRGYIELKKDE